MFGIKRISRKLAFCSLFFALNHCATASSIAEATDATCSVTLEGDSILWGGFVPGPRIAEIPADILKRKRPRYTITDNSFPGLMAHDRAPDFAAAPRSSRIVVIQHGINDALTGADYGAALLSMVTAVQTEGRIAVVTGLTHQIRKIKRRNQYDTIAKFIATQTGAFFADWGSVEYAAADMADPMHPGQNYTNRLMDRLIGVLDQIAPECAGDAPF